jgi:hypothetical protein
MTDALLLRAFTYLSGRGRLIDATGLARIEVLPCIGVVFGQAVLVRLGSHHTGLALKEFPDGEAAALGKEGGGQGEGGGTYEIQAELLEGRVNLEAKQWTLAAGHRARAKAMERVAEGATENETGNGVERKKRHSQ